MSEKKCMLWLGLVFLLLAVCLVPFGKATAADVPKEIRMGAIVSITGMNAMTGAEQKWAYEQAVADIDKKGGDFREGVQ
jgi:branched-chain amino acid transport system substrate-binding protein